MAAVECTTALRPLPRPLSTSTSSHNRSSIRRSKNAISPPPLLTPSHALHELSNMPSPPPTLPLADRWVICPQRCPVAPSTRTGLLLKRSILVAPASHQPSVKYPLTREKEEGSGHVMRSCCTLLMLHSCIAPCVSRNSTQRTGSTDLATGDTFGARAC